MTSSGGAHGDGAVGPPRWTCPACGLGLRPDDSIVVVRLRPFHVACAEAAFADRSAWEHTDATTLVQWARGMGWGSSA